MDFNQEPEHELTDVKVRTENKEYIANSAYLYSNYIHIYTSSDQPHTDHQVIISTDRLDEIVERDIY